MIVILFVLVLGSAPTPLADDKPDGYNAALFTTVGRTAEETGFGHLIFDLQLAKVKTSFATFYEMYDTTVEAHTGLDNSTKKDFLASLNQIREKLEMLWSFAFHSKDPGREDFEFTKGTSFKTAFETNVPVNTPTATPTITSTTPSSFSTTTTAAMADQGRRRRRRRKRAFWTQAATVTNLAAFGLSLYNRHQLSRIVKTAEDTTYNSNLVAEKAESNTVRINELATYVTNVKDHFQEIFKLLHQSSRAQVAKAYFNYLSVILGQYRSGLKDYLAGIVTLMDNRLSPFLIDASGLKDAYEDLLRKARQEGLQPLTEDASVVFQSLTTTVATEDDRLLAVVHVPMYRGSLMLLYRHLPAPFYLNENVVIRVKSPYSFIAINQAGTLAKQYSALDLQNCKEVSKIYHCPRENVLTKRLDMLCLYNLFHQKMEQIESTCEVVLDTIDNHAIQVSGDTFRIFAQNPVQLSVNCHTDTKVETIVGVYMLTLNKTCPRANTPTHLFVRNSQASVTGEIVSLPSVAKVENWLGTLVEGLDSIDVPSIVRDIQYQHPGPVSISQFRQHLEDRPINLILRIVHYVQYGVTAFVVTAVFYFAFRYCCRLIRPRLPWEMPYIVFGSRPSPHTNPIEYQPAPASAPEEREIIPLNRGITARDLVP